MRNGVRIDLRWPDHENQYRRRQQQHQLLLCEGLLRHIEQYREQRIEHDRERQIEQDREQQRQRGPHRENPGYNLPSLAKYRRVDSRVLQSGSGTNDDGNRQHLPVSDIDLEWQSRMRDLLREFYTNNPSQASPTDGGIMT
ncbi:hypothetical protein CHU98_g4631 [Xylaria longipes]|nr:hypothetical protein CHU98_g4631 [Xylaria longipes]